MFRFLIFFLTLMLISNSSVFCKDKNKDRPKPFSDLEKQIHGIFKGIVKEGSKKEQKDVIKKYGPKFRVLKTDHFKIISDTNPRYHKVVSLQIELFYKEVHPRFFKKKMKPVTFFLINDGLDYEKFMVKAGHGDNKDGYGMYSSKERCLYARRYFPDGRVSGVGTLFHEISHAMVDAETSVDVPAWFDEGFASVFEHGRIVKGEWIYGNPNPWRENPYRDYFEKNQIPTLKKYFSLSRQDYYGSGDTNLYYNTGRSLCLYLLREHGEKTLAKFVRSALKGKNGEDSLKKATKMKLSKIEKEWRESIKKINFGGAYVHRSRKMKGKQKLDYLSEGAKDHPDYGHLRANLADAYIRNRKNEQAIVEAEAALKDERYHFPQQAWQLLGVAYWNLNDNQKAKEAFEKSISFQPWVEDILEYEFNSLIKILENLGDKDGALHLKEIFAQMQEEDKVND